MRARLFSPAKTAMSSGTAKAKGWVLDFEPTSGAEIDPLMGWTSSDNTQNQVRLKFATRAEAEAYAQEHGIEVITSQPTRRQANIRAQGYAENFAYKRRKAWTH